jgi:hypothetical protein
MCDKDHPPMKIESCGKWEILVEEAANIVKGLTISLLRFIPPEAMRGAADVIKEAIAIGFREGLKQIREKEEKKNEAAD